MSCTPDTMEVQPSGFRTHHRNGCRRRPRGGYPKIQERAVAKRQKRTPEYLEADEVNTLIRLAPNPKANS